MAPGMVSSNEVTSTTGINEVSKSRISKNFSKEISSTMVSSTTGTHTSKMPNKLISGYSLSETCSNQVSSTTGKS